MEAFLGQCNLCLDVLLKDLSKKYLVGFSPLWGFALAFDLIMVSLVIVHCDLFFVLTVHLIFEV